MKGPQRPQDGRLEVGAGFSPHPFGSPEHRGAVWLVLRVGLPSAGGVLTLTLDKHLNPGDANFDAVTDVRDFNIWNAHKFTDDTDWASGDFDGNGVTDVRDFNQWNATKFTSATAPPAEGQVPEPSTVALLFTVLTFASAFWLRRRTADEVLPAPDRGCLRRNCTHWYQLLDLCGRICSRVTEDDQAV